MGNWLSISAAEAACCCSQGTPPKRCHYQFLDCKYGKWDNSFLVYTFLHFLLPILFCEHRQVIKIWYSFVYRATTWLEVNPILAGAPWKRAICIGWATFPVLIFTMINIWLHFISAVIWVNIKEQRLCNYLFFFEYWHHFLFCTPSMCC